MWTNRGRLSKTLFDNNNNNHHHRHRCHHQHHTNSRNEKTERNQLIKPWDWSWEEVTHGIEDVDADDKADDEGNGAGHVSPALVHHRDNAEQQEEGDHKLRHQGLL